MFILGIGGKKHPVLLQMCQNMYTIGVKDALDTVGEDYVKGHISNIIPLLRGEALLKLGSVISGCCNSNISPKYDKSHR